MMRTAGFFSFRKRDTPVMVPVVPMALTRMGVILPPVCSPDPRARGPKVNARLVGIGELVQHATLAFALPVLGQIARVFHAAGARREHQLRAKGLRGLGALINRSSGMISTMR